MSKLLPPYKPIIDPAVSDVGAYQESCMRGRLNLIPLLDAEPVAEHDGELGHGGSPIALGVFPVVAHPRKTKYSSPCCRMLWAGREKGR